MEAGRQHAFRRVLLKLSGQALGSETRAIDPATTKSIAGTLRVARSLDVDIAIVVGGGNIFRGMAAAAGGMDRTTGDHIGMMATVQNALALQDALEDGGVDTRVMSAIEIRAVCEPYIRRKAIRHLEKGRVVICAAGTGNPYFSTDSAAALRALELECEAILAEAQVRRRSSSPRRTPRQVHPKSPTCRRSARPQVMDDRAPASAWTTACPSMCSDDRRQHRARALRRAWAPWCARLPG
jgi:uridylate kinase